MLKISKTSFYKQVKENLKTNKAYCQNIICQECPYGENDDCLKAILTDLIVKGVKR